MNVRPLPLLPTTVVGSYPQPHWLIDHELLAKGVPRVRASNLWRVAPKHLEEAQDAATLAAIRDMELAGIDIISDGEIRRESYSNHFVSSLDGVEAESEATIKNRAGRAVRVPRVVGKIRRSTAVEIRGLRVLREATDRAIKITLPGPFTMTQQAKDEVYNDPEAVAMDFAAALNEEALELEAAGGT